MAGTSPPKDRDGFEIAVICALKLERDAVEALMEVDFKEQGRTYGKASQDRNAYTTGVLGGKPIVLAYPRDMGTLNAATVASDMRYSFKNIKIGLVVGVAGGAPQSADGTDIYLGDVIISTAVVQYDFGRQYPDGFRRKNEVESTLGRASAEIANFLALLEGYRASRRLTAKTNDYRSDSAFTADFTIPGSGEDHLFPSDYRHKHRDPQQCKICSECIEWDDPVCDKAEKAGCDELGCDKSRCRRRETDPSQRPQSDGSPRQSARTAKVHFGRVASANGVLKSGLHRDKLMAAERVIAFEMEGAGIWDQFPTVVVKSVCDYADSHKNKAWQGHAAAVAASCAKAILEEWETAEQPYATIPRESSIPQAAPAPPKPTSTVPFRRDVDFVERGDLLSRIDERCSQPAGRVALVGLGGVGKSQLVIEYAHRVKDRSRDTRVFWVFASNAARVEIAYKGIADKLVLPGRDESTVNVVELVTSWLSDESNERWLMIVDNIDDLETLHAEVEGSKEKASIASVVPQSSNGAVLITSRNIDVAREMVGREKDILRVGQMNEEEAAELLRKKLVEPPDSGEANLLAALDCFPLAITQAAAYINRQPGMSVSAYLRRLHATESKKMLLEKNFRDVRRHEKAKSSILKTWQISLEQIKLERPGAADLLSFMSFFNRQGIPKFMLRYYKGHFGDDETATEDRSSEEADDELEEDVAILDSFSLISTTMKDDEFDMHGLVQFATRIWLSSMGEEEEWWTRFVSGMAAAYPVGEYENWPTCRTLLPHIQSITEKQPSGGEQSEAWTQVLTNAGWYAWRQGLLLQAEGLIEMSFEKCKQLFGVEDTRTLKNLHILASVLQDQGKYEESENMNRRALAGREAKLGKDHSDTLSSVGNLAVVLHYQGKYEESENMNRRALAGREAKLGKNHPDTLNSVNSLAGVLRYQGKYEESENMHRRALEAREETLGKNHPDTIRSVSNLAVVLHDQGKYEESEAMNRRVLVGREKTLRKNHPDTLTSVSNLAGVLRYQGKHEESEAMNRRALVGKEATLGKNHPDTLTSVNNLAYFLGKLQRYDDARPLYERACAGFQSQLGSSHPTTVACHRDFSDMLSAMHNIKE